MGEQWNRTLARTARTKNTYSNINRTEQNAFSLRMVLVGGWRRSTSWVSASRSINVCQSLIYLFLMLSPAQARSSPPFDPWLSLLGKYPAYSDFPVHNSKRNGGMPDECRGRYDTSIYTQLDNICEDCYNLYKEADVHSFCRGDCFSSSYFQRCLQALLLEEGRFINMAQIIGWF